MIFYFMPIILLTVIIEYPFVRNKLRGSYKLKDTLANIFVGLGSVVISLLSRTWVYLPYFYLYKYRIFDLPKVWPVYIILIILEDYCYYWSHRVSHECRLLWCAHETHHSSRTLNISTAIRQPWTGKPWTWIFWMPLVLLGFPPEWILIQQSLNLYYQLFIHTEVVKKLGFLEYILNTPSHHRVHHAINLEYLDKNYGGIFIIWDRIHGTFQEEQAIPEYGTRSNFKSFNPVIICTHMWVKLFRELSETPGSINKIKTIFYPPGWRYDGTGKTTKIMQQKIIKTN